MAKIAKPEKPKKSDSYGKWVKYAEKLEAYQEAGKIKCRQEAVKAAISKGDLEGAKRIVKSKNGSLSVSNKKSQY